VNLFDFTHHVGAAEFQFLAAAAGAHCIGVDRHVETVNGWLLLEIQAAAATILA
jgi:hypothetical protein